MLFAQETVQAYDRTRALFQALSMAPAAMVAALEQSSWRFSGQEYTALLQVHSLRIAPAYIMDIIGRGWTPLSTAVSVTVCSWLKGPRHT